MSNADAIGNVVERYGGAERIYQAGPAGEELIAASGISMLVIA
jgi:hypothetical protein